MQYKKDTGVKNNEFIWYALKDVFYKKLCSLVLPITIQQFMLALVSATDAVMLGVISQTALSALSLAGQVQFVMNLFISGISVGASVMAAQYWGKRDALSVEKIMPVALRANLLCGGIFTLAAAVIPDKIMEFMTNDAALIASGSVYLRAVSLSYILCGISQVYLILLKNTDNAKISSVISYTAVLINIIVNAILIFGLLGFPAMGIVIGNLLGQRKFQLAKTYGRHLTHLSIAVGVGTCICILLISPWITAHSINVTVLDGIFCAGGDSKFDVKCNMLGMWCLSVSVGFLAAFVLKLPIAAVYAIINLDEIVKIPAVYLHYKKHIWVRNITR